MLFGVVLANGVYQDGGAETRYPRWLRRFVSAGLLSLPAHAALAIWAICLRVGQYGWTPDRLTALLVAVILALHALLLAWAVLPPRDGRWLARLSTGNPLLAAMVVALLLASQSPLLDFRALTVASQLERLTWGELRLAAAPPPRPAPAATPTRPPTPIPQRRPAATAARLHGRWSASISTCSANSSAFRAGRRWNG